MKKENPNAYEDWRADRDEERRLRSTDNREKDAELRRIGFEPAEHPLAHECRVCGYNRRYSAYPQACLFCDAFN